MGKFQHTGTYQELNKKQEAVCIADVKPKNPFMGDISTIDEFDVWVF
jgi:hypothetical protein